MPLPNIKTIKTFGRRKSAGNSIDEGNLLTTAPVSTFRVIPRDDINRRSVGGAQTLRFSSNNEYLPARQNSYEDDAKSSNRGSNSTGTSSNSRVFDPTNTRFSSSSTLQSPVEAIKKVGIQATLRAAGNGGLQIIKLTQKQDSQFFPNQSPSPAYLNLPQDADSYDDFGDLFAGLEKRNSALYDGGILSKPPAPVVLRSESEPMLGDNSRMSFPTRPAKTPPPPPSPLSPPNIRKIESSPFSNDGRTSQDGLMSSPPPVDSPQDKAPPPPPHHTIPTSGREQVGTGNRLRLERSTSSESFARSGTQGDADALMVKESVRAHRASVAPSTLLSVIPRDRDEKAKQESLLLAQKGSVSQSSLSSSRNSLKTPSLSSASGSSLALNDSVSAQTQLRQATPTTSTDSHGGSSNSTTPRATEVLPVQEEEEEEEESPLFDPSIAGALAAMDMHDSQAFTERKAEPPPQKVLTAAQFQILKKHEDLDNRKKVGRANGSDDEYEDDEDDEATRAQKRKLQEHKEAQHKIWRQRMSKAIGDQSSPLPSRASFQRVGQGTPSLSFDNSFATSEAGGSCGSSDDEDIPLAVLQAHGFPNKNNPPDPRLSAHSFLGVSRPLSSVSSLPRPGSPGGARSVAGGPRGSLPPFARKLPQDPYLGSSDFVNPTNREAPGFNGQRPLSVYTPAGAPPPPNIPNGLVGVIAEEERQRSMRRGSPNQPGLRQSAYLPPPIPPMVPGMPMIGLPGMGMGPAMSPMGPGMMPVMGPAQASTGSDQQQLNQQMFQLLQQQSAMLQQLMTHGGSPGVQQPVSFANTPMSPQMRPMSMAAGSVRQRESRTMSMVNLAPPMQPRTMSMINIPQPHMGASFGMEGLMSGAASVRGLGLQDNHYAPSVAPSERSNIGQPSRYKPVHSSNLADGGSTITAISTIQPSKVEKKKSFLSAIIHPTHKGRGKENAVEDDEEDWSSFAMKRRGHA